MVVIPSKQSHNSDSKLNANEDLVNSVSFKKNNILVTMSETDTRKANAADSHDIALTPLTIIRYLASIGLLIFSIIIVGALMFTGNTRVAKDASPWVALIVCVSA